MASGPRKTMTRQAQRRRNRSKPPSHRNANNQDGNSVSLGPLANLIGYAIRQAQIAVFRDFQRAFAKYNIRPIQYGVLAVIETNPGLKQTQVCAALGIKRANFVPLLNDLERRRLAERRSAQDQRANALYLTAKGALLMQTLREVNGSHERRVAANLTARERAQLLDMLNRTRLALETES